MRSTFSEEKRNQSDIAAESEVECISLDDSDQEYDVLFDNMETIDERNSYCKPKKQKLG